MDRELLKHYLEQGLSLTEIGILVNRDPSTVGYWVQKHGLVANGREKYAPKGGIARDRLAALVSTGATYHAIANELGVSISTVRHWSKKYGLPTGRTVRRRHAEEARANAEPRKAMHCLTHGVTDFVLDSRGRYLCPHCRSEAVARRRRKVKRILVEEFGGKCILCGYDRHPGALQFHHLDPAEKSFGVARGGITTSIEKLREEAKKCVLLCSNCHAEVEGGVAVVPG